MTNATAVLAERIAAWRLGDNTLKFRQNEGLATHCTFRIGGAADLYAEPSNADELAFLIQAARELSVSYTVLGHGSNVLFDDDGYRGLIISTEKMNSVRLEGCDIVAQCGALLTSCAVIAQNASLSGMECLYGIPGSIGGAVFMNAGAYGGEMSDIVAESVYLDTESLELKTVRGAEHLFGYRTSIFRENGGIVLSTRLSLKADSREAISERMADYKRRRIEKQPLEYPSAGSVFKRYPGTYTAQLIDEAGLKGAQVGGARVSDKHAGFIVNVGGASAADVRELISRIKSVIREKHGFDIETEIIEVK